MKKFPSISPKTQLIYTIFAYSNLPVFIVVAKDNLDALGVTLNLVSS